MGRHPTILIINFMFIMLIFIITPTFSGPIYTQFLTPNFTASNYQFIDNSGAFLSSPNATFLAAISSAPWAPQQPSPATAAAAASASAFYFSILHAASNEIIWTANRASPISNSDKLTLTPAGLALYNSTNAAVWSTPPPPSPVASLELRDDGNLVLLDRMNRTLWESFDYPTDTVVAGQRLPVGKALAAGEYRFSVTASDAVLRWSGADYWKLSMDPSAFNDAVSPVEYMEVDSEGFYLVGANRSVIFQVTLSSNRTNGFRVARLNADGRYVVKSYVVNQWTQNEFTAPGDDCQLPMSCGSIGLCVDSSVSNSGSCTCSSGFRNDPNLKGCTPASFSLPGGGCDAMNNGGNNASSNLNSSEISYVKLDNGIDYFANKFVSPIAVGMSSTLACETLCTNNCSCLGFFYANSSGSCYLIKNQIGSVTTSSANGNDRVGYIKAIGGATNGSGNDGDDDDQGSNNFPIAALVLLPSAGFFLLVLLLVLVFIKRRRSVITKKKSIKLGRPNSNSSSDLDAFSIPGLPVRFDFDELEGATENFGSQIGSGGFGSVYKGTLADKSVVAVKKINNLGNQGKKEFCTEIAIIGKIHHVNLVRLRGFCAEGSQRLLVYEYMNRGSLDRTLFGAGPAIEWQERVDIALGTARGLAYLHSGCENKIIHCDIKPENILLHDHFHVKISDFGLSKLLSPEQSSHFTTMRGTRGYLAPEWLTSSAISDKTDVYSYGMVLLELVSGRKNCSMRTQSHSTDGETTTMSSSSSIPVYFPLLALDMHEQGRYVELADPRLEGRVTNEAVEKLVRIALCCVHEDPNLRPTMVNVVSMLEGTIPLGKPRGESLNFLRFYGRRFNESSVLGGSNGDNRFMGFSQVIINASHTSTTSGSGASYSYISSQQISGPR